MKEDAVSCSYSQGGKLYIEVINGKINCLRRLVQSKKVVEKDDPLQ